MKKNKLIKFLIFIIIVSLLIAIYVQYNKYTYEQKIIEAYASYNEEQQKCKVIGTTSNYIYITRLKNTDEIIEGATWELTDLYGNSKGTFETDENGNGGLVGLEYGEYYLKETSVPEGYEKINEKYKIIISAVDTKYILNILNESNKEETAVLFVARDEEDNPIQGIEYTIRDIQDNKIITVTTNAKGLAGAQKMTPGMYYVTETNRDDSEIHYFEIRDSEITRLDLVYKE